MKPCKGNYFDRHKENEDLSDLISMDVFNALNNVSGAIGAKSNKRDKVIVNSVDGA